LLHTRQLLFQNSHHPLFKKKLRSQRDDEEEEDQRGKKFIKVAADRTLLAGEKCVACHVVVRREGAERRLVDRCTQKGKFIVEDVLCKYIVYLSFFVCIFFSSLMSKV
jgi:hypothetical protein